MNRRTGLGRAGGVLLGALLATWGVDSTVSAATLQTTVPVTATVTGACTGFSAAAVPFEFTLGTTPAQQSSTLTINCSTGTPWAITASADDTNYTCGPIGLNGIFSDGNGHQATYAIYPDEAGASRLASTPACGNGTENPLTGSGTGADQTATLYFEVLGKSFTEPGSYSSSPTLILTF